MSNYNHLSKGILYVNKENPAAINVYRKLGFKVYSEELWVDYGTGLVP
jgi:predicted GNAT family acetyltransferase